MGRIRKDCPICLKQGLVRLPNHLRDIHGLSPEDVMESSDGQSETGDISEDDAPSESGDIFDDDDDASEDGDDDDDPPTDETDEETDEDDVQEGCDGDDWYEFFVEPVFEQFQEEMDAKVAELEDEEEMSTKEARETTFEEFLPAMNKAVKRRITRMLRANHQFKKDPTFQKIVETAKTGRREDDMDWDESVSYALNKRSFLLDKVLRSWIPPFADKMEEDSD